jgi:hypothetical protein
MRSSFLLTIASLGVLIALVGSVEAAGRGSGGGLGGGGGGVGSGGAGGGSGSPSFGAEPTFSGGNPPGFTHAPTTVFEDGKPPGWDQGKASWKKNCIPTLTNPNCEPPGLKGR